MISSIQNVKKARELRLEGKSLSEISEKLSVSISTLSAWLKDITLNEAQQDALRARVKNKISKGRMNALISLKSARIFKEKSIYEQAEKEFERLHKDPFFMLGLALYWSSGAKKGCFQFSSSDQGMNFIMMDWIKKYLNPDENLVKQRNYNGYRRIDITRIDVLRRVIAWQKLLIQYYGKVISA